MKPRALRTYKILAVALTAATGCTRAVGSEPGAEIAALPAQELSPGAAARTAEPPPIIPQRATPPAITPAAETPVLTGLRGELEGRTRDEALARLAHFRPLCDKDGYPLVGNMARKGPGPGYEPSSFCEEVRRREPR